MSLICREDLIKAIEENVINTGIINKAYSRFVIKTINKMPEVTAECCESDAAEEPTNE